MSLLDKLNKQRESNAVRNTEDISVIVTNAKPYNREDKQPQIILSTKEHGDFFVLKDKFLGGLPTSFGDGIPATITLIEKNDAVFVDAVSLDIAGFDAATSAKIAQASKLGAVLQF